MKQHYLIRWDENEFGHRKYQYSKHQQQGEKRYGYRVKCPKCRFRSNFGSSTGGKEGLRHCYQSFISTEINHAKICDGILRVWRDYHATALGHKFVEQTSNQAITSTTYVDVTNAVISNTDLTPGKKYLLVFTAQPSNTNTSADAGLKIIHGSTDFEGSEEVVEENATSPRMSYFWYTVWTAVSGEDIKLQAKVSTATCNIDQITMTAIKLSDDLTENTDWFFAENTTDTTIQSAWADDTNKASITFTPNGTDDWLVLATAQLVPNSVTVQFETRINASGGVTDTGVMWSQEGEDGTTDVMVQTLAKVYTPTNTSTTFETETEREAADGGTKKYNSIFALNLNKLKNHAFQATQAEINLDTTDTFSTSTNIATATMTPDVTGDVWCLGFFIYDVGSGALVPIRFRMQIDDTDQPDTQTSDNYQHSAGWDVTDELPYAIQSIENLSNASHTLDMDATAGTARPVEDRLAMMVTMELASAPAPPAAPPLVTNLLLLGVGQ